MPDSRRRSDTLPAPLPPPPGAGAEFDFGDGEEPTQPGILLLAAIGTESRARIARAARSTQPLPPPRPPAKRDPGR